MSTYDNEKDIAVIRTKKKRGLFFGGMILACAMIMGGFSYRLIMHEQNQNNRISTLQQQVAILNETVKENDEADAFIAKQGYHYLAIGNSITIHGIADYWWGEWGMAASEKESDYVNMITSSLENARDDGESVSAASYNYSVWEIQSHDRAQTWEFLDPYLFPGIDLITVQLSENCSDLTTFQSDFAALLAHIREVCGEDTQIIVIDDFWSDEKSEMKRSVCDEMGIAFADLSDIRGRKEYQAGIGTSVHGNDGEIHMIGHEGVAKHPRDKGMLMIAERVLEKVVNVAL